MQCKWTDLDEDKLDSGSNYRVIIKSLAKLDWHESLMVSGLMFTFSNESPGAEEGLLELQGGEALVFLEALVESPEPR